jgi:hypothetical protein
MTPQELARRYDRCIALVAEWPWHHSEACAFAEWLAGHWQPVCPLPPVGPPSAASAVGGRPDGLRWFAAGAEIVGYVAGHAAGCYRIPRRAEPPKFATDTDAIPREAGQGGERTPGKEAATDNNRQR